MPTVKKRRKVSLSQKVLRAFLDTRASSVAVLEMVLHELRQRGKLTPADEELYLARVDEIYQSAAKATGLRMSELCHGSIYESRYRRA